MIVTLLIMFPTLQHVFQNELSDAQRELEGLRQQMTDKTQDCQQAAERAQVEYNNLKSEHQAEKAKLEGESPPDKDYTKMVPFQRATGAYEPSSSLFLEPL